MAATKRLYEIARALGVPVDEVIAKCRDEGIPGIDSPESRVKIGLEMTIREWFADRLRLEPSASNEDGLVSVWVDPGDATIEDLSALYESLSDLCRAGGGVGLIVRRDKSLRHCLEVQPL